MNKKTPSLASLEEEGIQNPSYKKALFCAQKAVEQNAENVRIIPLSHLSSVADYFVICSCSSSRQAQSLARLIEDSLRSSSPILSQEGFQEGRWIVLDCGNLLVHLFLHPLREYYQLENFWGSGEEICLPEGKLHSLVST